VLTTLLTVNLNQRGQMVQAETGTGTEIETETGIGTGTGGAVGAGPEKEAEAETEIGTEIGIAKETGRGIEGDVAGAAVVTERGGAGVDQETDPREVEVQAETAVQSVVES
jgi:hypothetical protein